MGRSRIRRMGQCAWRLSSNRSGHGGRPMPSGAIPWTIMVWSAAPGPGEGFGLSVSRRPESSAREHQHKDKAGGDQGSLQLQRQRDVGGGTEELEESAHFSSGRESAHFRHARFSGWRDRSGRSPVEIQEPDRERSALRRRRTEGRVAVDTAARQAQQPMKSIRRA
jgi:hypothetical protein